MNARAPTTVADRDLVGAYYLATPVFALLDFGAGLPVRVAGLEDPWHRGLYYLAIFGLGVVTRVRPGTTPWIGMLESAGNILLLVLAIMLPIWSLPEAALTGAELVGPFDRISIANVVLSGSAFTVSFYRNQAAALRAQ